MTIKDKFAALLRRWASKLSPEKYQCPDGLNLPSHLGMEYYKVKRVGMAYSISLKEEAHAHEAERNGDPGAVARMREEYKQRIAHGIVARLWEDRVVEYSEERDSYTGELRIVGFLYVSIREDNNNTNPIKD